MKNTFTERLFNNLNDHISLRSYMVGYKPSQLDYELYLILRENGNINNYVHLKRWYEHIASFTENECKTFDSHNEHIELIKIILDWKVIISFV